MNTFGNYDQTNQRLFDLLNIPATFDMLTRELVIGNKRCMCYFLNGFIKDDIVEKMFEFLLTIKDKELDNIHTIEQFQAHFISFTESTINGDLQQLVTMVLSGMLIMIIEGYNQAIVLDARQYRTWCYGTRR